MNKTYLKWLRELKTERLFIDFGQGDYSAHRQNFLKGMTPNESAFMCVPW